MRIKRYSFPLIIISFSILAFAVGYALQLNEKRIDQLIGDILKQYEGTATYYLSAINLTIKEFHFKVPMVLKLFSLLGFVFLISYIIFSLIFRSIGNFSFHYKGLRDFISGFLEVIKEFPLMLLAAGLLLAEIFVVVYQGAHKLLKHLDIQMQKRISGYKKVKTKIIDSSSVQKIEKILHLRRELSGNVALDLINTQDDSRIAVTGLELPKNGERELLYKVTGTFSDLKGCHFLEKEISSDVGFIKDSSSEKEEYLTVYSAPKDKHFDKDLDVFAEFIQTWPVESGKRLIIANFPDSEERSFLDAVDGKTMLSHIVHKNVLPNTDVIMKSNMNNQVSPKKLLSLVAILRERYENVYVVEKDQLVNNWQVAYDCFNRENSSTLHVQQSSLPH